MTDAERAFRARVGAQLDTVIRQHIGDIWPKLEADNIALGGSPAEVVRTYGSCTVIYGGGRPIDVADVIRQEASRLQSWKVSAIDQLVAFVRTTEGACNADHSDPVG